MKKMIMSALLVSGMLGIRIAEAGVNECGYPMGNLTSMRDAEKEMRSYIRSNLIDIENFAANPADITIQAVAGTTRFYPGKSDYPFNEKLNYCPDYDSLEGLTYAGEFEARFFDRSGGAKCHLRFRVYYWERYKYFDGSNDSKYLTNWGVNGSVIGSTICGA